MASNRPGRNRPPLLGFVPIETAGKSRDLLRPRRTVSPLHRPAPRRPLPRRCRHRRFGSRSTTSKVLFRPRGFAPPRRFSPPFAPLPELPPGRAETRFRMGVAGLLHPAADQGSPRFRCRRPLAHHQWTPRFPATRTPFEGIPQPQPYPVTRATCLPDVFVPRSPDLPSFPLPFPTLSPAPETRPSPRPFSIAGYVPTAALCRRRLACPPVGFCSPHRFFDRRFRFPAICDEGPTRLRGSSPFRERPFLHALSLPSAVLTCSRRPLRRTAHSVPPLSRDPALLRQAESAEALRPGVARVTDEPRSPTPGCPRVLSPGPEPTRRRDGSEAPDLPRTGAPEEAPTVGGPQLAPSDGNRREGRTRAGENPFPGSLAQPKPCALDGRPSSRRRKAAPKKSVRSGS
jgi:hypothetical protein